jgi:hypothetical protein
VGALKADYITLFQTDAGRRVLMELMDSYHMLSLVHTIGDPYETAFRDGQRSVVVYMLRESRPEGLKAPEAELDMLDELLAES